MSGVVNIEGELVRRCKELEAEVERLREENERMLDEAEDMGYETGVVDVAQDKEIAVLKTENAELKKAFHLACTHLAGLINGAYCPIDADDHNQCINNCTDCEEKGDAYCWINYFYYRAKKEGKHDEIKP